jgi:hypothetical protein
MYSISLSTDRLRHLLHEIDENKLEYHLHPARDLPGPGGGVYITAQTRLTSKTLDWIENRNPSPDSTAYLDVVFVRDGEPPPRPGEKTETGLPPGLSVAADDEPQQENKEKVERRAEKVAEKVVTAAKEVALDAERVYRNIGKADFSMSDLDKPDVQASMREFERGFRQFRGAVKKAIDEYLDGNTLVMDLILKFKLDKPTVQHALSVAAFSTEMATLLAMKEGSGDEEQLQVYFGDLSNEHLMELLGEDPAQIDEGITSEQVHEKRYELFRNELVEIFLGGFMHDCGLWAEPFNFQEGHEVKGAKLIARTQEVHEFAPALVAIVLFHSDLVRLAKKHSAVLITEKPEDLEKTAYKREFYDSAEDAQTSIDLRHGNFEAEVLNPDHLRKILPVALAEHFISHTEDVYTKSPVDVIAELCQAVGSGQFPKYMVVLCNSRVEVVAPRRSLVKLAGYISVIVDGKGKTSRRAQRLEVDGFDAGCLLHGRDRNSPHLITLFVRRGDGSRAKAEYVNPQEASLWERAAGLDSRMYLPAGRYRNNLSFRSLDS